MKESQIIQGQRIIESIRKLMKLEDEIKEKYNNLRVDSPDEDIQELFILLVRNGYGGKMRKTIIEIRENIHSDIQDLQEELEKL